MRGSRVNPARFLANVLGGADLGGSETLFGRRDICERSDVTREREAKMVKVQLEVRTGSARFRVSARAGSIRRAVSLAGARHPRGEVRLVSPVEPEAAFAGAPDGAEFLAAATLPSAA